MSMRTLADRRAADTIETSTWADWLATAVERFPRLWQGLGRLESSMLRERLAAIPLQAPVYVIGPARSGAHLLFEWLAAHTEMASHVGGDDPLIYTPWWQQRILRRGVGEPAAAVEEVLWTGFFPHLHQTGVSDVLGFMTDAPAFEDFYRDHQRKILLLRGGRRYLARSAPITTRIEYLLNLFPEARFVLPVREPVAHVASLMRLQRRLLQRHRADPRALRTLRRRGLFEFGLDRRPLHIGDGTQAGAIAAAWRAGREAEGYARVWDDVYRFVAERIAAMPALREAVLVVRLEDLCADPERSLQRLLAHCGLEAGEHGQVRRCAMQLRRAGVDEPALDDADRRTIRQYTAATAARYGYGRDETSATTLRRGGRFPGQALRRMSR